MPAWLSISHQPQTSSSSVLQIRPPPLPVKTGPKSFASSLFCLVQIRFPRSKKNNGLVRVFRPITRGMRMRVSFNQDRIASCCLCPTLSVVYPRPCLFSLVTLSHAHNPLVSLREHASPQSSTTLYRRPAISIRYLSLARAWNQGRRKPNVHYHHLVSCDLHEDALAKR